MKNLKINTKYIKKLNKIFYSKVNGTPLLNPTLVSANKLLAKKMKISNDDLYSDDFIKLINTQITAIDTEPFSYAYSGHQFGHHVPNLGDGRALNIGKLNNYHLQLKGSGLTPYSRDGDGRAVLRSSIREYLMSEAMYGLGIPTSRALGIISSTTSVYRSYDVEKASIVLRTSSSWIRFGTFEFAYISKKKKENLEQLADFVIEENYSKLKNLDNKYDELYFSIVDKTIELLALWQSVGFMHGVLNTDNMSIDGLTIDYGPYAMMENFDRKSICNQSDYEGRYSFENQPFIAQWNLSVLAKVLSPIVNEDLMNSYNDMFIGKFKEKYFSIMVKKTGLNKELKSDTKLIIELLSILEKGEIDYTPFFYYLSCDNRDEIKKLSTYQTDLEEWFSIYDKRLKKEEISKKDRLKKMRKINPKYVLKNYMLQEAIELAQNGDFTLVNDLLKIAQNPYDDHKKFERYAQKTPDDLSNLTCSCSS